MSTEAAGPHAYPDGSAQPATEDPRAAASAEAGLTTIVVRRDQRRGGRIRHLQVHVDGEPAGALARQTSLALRVRPGVHRVWTGQAWQRTDRLELALDEGAEVHLRVSAPGGRGRGVTQVMRGRSSRWRLRPDDAARRHVRRRWVWAGRRPKAWSALFVLALVVVAAGGALTMRDVPLGVVVMAAGVATAGLAMFRAVQEHAWRPVPARAGGR